MEEEYCGEESADESDYEDEVVGIRFGAEWRPVLCKVYGDEDCDAAVEDY